MAPTKVRIWDPVRGETLRRPGAGHGACHFRSDRSGPSKPKGVSENQGP